DLAIAKAGAATAVAGDPAGFNYTLTVTNMGPSDNSGGFTVSDVLPAGTTFQSAGSTPGASVSGQTVSYTNGTGIVNGGVQSLTIHVNVSPSTPDGALLDDSAT